MCNKQLQLALQYSTDERIRIVALDDNPERAEGSDEVIEALILQTSALSSGEMSGQSFELTAFSMSLGNNNWGG